MITIQNHKERSEILIVLVILIPLGLGTKFYYGPFYQWVHNYAGDIFYIFFFLFLFKLFFIQCRSIFLAFYAFLFSTIIEFSQLFNSPLLGKIRSTFIGRTLIGNGFNPADIFYYLVGATLGVLGLVLIKRDNRFEGSSKNQSWHYRLFFL